mgnify:CR=1 FL=1
MATLTIIKDDKFVSVDDVGLTLDAVDLSANVHAIQWDGSTGHIEYNDGTANETIDSISAYSTITDDHATKKAAIEKEISDAEAALTEAKKTYSYKRVYDETTSYASIADQLDQLYKDMVAGKLDTTGTWATGIKEVKDAHPK